MEALLTEGLRTIKKADEAKAKDAIAAAGSPLPGSPPGNPSFSAAAMGPMEALLTEGLRTIKKADEARNDAILVFRSSPIEE